MDPCEQDILGLGLWGGVFWCAVAVQQKVDRKMVIVRVYS